MHIIIILSIVEVCMQSIKEFSVENFLKLAETLEEWGNTYSPLVMYISSESYRKLEEKILC